MSDTVAGHEEIETSRIIAASHRDGIRKAVRAWGDAYEELKNAPTFLDSVKALAALKMASETMQKEAKEAAEKLKSHLHSMMLLGPTSFPTAHHDWLVVEMEDLVDIHDVSAVPEEFMVTPEPRPDRGKIAAYLRNKKPGAAVNWATLVTGRTTVRCTSRKT